MKTLVIAFFLLISQSFIYAQQKKEKIPREVRKSVSRMAKYITRNCKTDQQRTDSIYHWITHNIAYDYEVLEESKSINFQPPSKTLKSKKAICSGYVYLMQAMLQEVNIASEYVEGYTRPYEMDTTFSIIDADHAWIAIKINNQWKLADPTWDAGYIGRIPKKEKTYPKRWLKEKKFKKKPESKPKKKGKEGKQKMTREEKRKKRITNKKLKFDKQQAEREPFTNKFGFVYQPEKDWYLIDKDTFLLSHLPTIPQWQLKTNPITIEQFCDKDENLPKNIAKPKGATMEFDKLNNEFHSKNLLDQWMYTAEKGHVYNGDNYGVKAIHYHNFIAALTDEGFKKALSHLPLEHATPIAQTLYNMSDTVLIFSKAALETQKEMYKFVKKDIALKFKSEQLADKNTDKAIKTGTKNIEKMYDLIDKSVERTKTEQESMEQKQEDLSAKFPGVDTEIEIQNQDETVLSSLMYSYDSLKMKIEDYYYEWDHLTDSTALNAMYDASSYSDYYLRSSEEYLSFNSLGVTKEIKDMDSSAQASLMRISKIMLDSLTKEIPSKDPYNDLKAMEKLIKQYNPVLKNLQNEKKIENAAAVETALYSGYYSLLNQHAEFLENSKTYCAFLESSLREFENEINRIEQSLAAVIQAKEKRNKQLNDEFEKSNDRSVHLYTTASKNAKKWKTVFKQKMN